MSLRCVHTFVKNLPERPCGAFRRICDRAYKPGSVLAAIYLAPQLPAGSSRLLGTAGPAKCPSTALLRDRVYIVKPMSPWAGCALTAPFHPYRTKAAVSLCCTCPGVTPGGRYPLSLPCGARTFLIYPPLGEYPQLPGPVAGILYRRNRELSNPHCKIFLPGL